MEYHSGGSLPLLGRPRYCPGANANGGYLCETGHCCGETGCCTYYYELWWFWLLWTVLILFSCCCAYRHRRAKQRLQQQQRQREISLLAYHGARTGPSSMLDLSFLASLKLPSYEEVAAQPSTPPPPYSAVFTTPRYPQPPRASDPHLLTQHDPLLHHPLSDGPSSLSSDNSSSCSCDSCCPSSPCSSSLSAAITYETDTSHASTPSEATPLALDVTMETVAGAASWLQVSASEDVGGADGPVDPRPVGAGPGPGPGSAPTASLPGPHTAGAPDGPPGTLRLRTGAPARIHCGSPSELSPDPGRTLDQTTDSAGPPTSDHSPSPGPIPEPSNLIQDPVKGTTNLTENQEPEPPISDGILVPTLHPPTTPGPRSGAGPPSGSVQVPHSPGSGPGPAPVPSLGLPAASDRCGPGRSGSPESDHEPPAPSVLQPGSSSGSGSGSDLRPPVLFLTPAPPSSSCPVITIEPESSSSPPASPPCTSSTSLQTPCTSSTSPLTPCTSFTSPLTPCTSSTSPTSLQTPCTSSTSPLTPCTSSTSPQTPCTSSTSPLTPCTSSTSPTSLQTPCTSSTSPLTPCTSSLPAPVLLLDPLTALSSSSGHASSLSPSPRASQSPPKQTVFSPCVDVFEPGPPSWEEEEEEEEEQEEKDDEDEDEGMGADESQYRHRRLTGDSGIEVCRCQVEEEEEEEEEQEEEEGEEEREGRREGAGGGAGGGGEKDEKGGGSSAHDSVDCPARGAELTLCASEDGGKVVIVMETA